MVYFCIDSVYHYAYTDTKIIVAVKLDKIFEILPFLCAFCYKSSIQGPFHVAFQFRDKLYSRGFLSSTSPEVIMKFNSSPFS